MSETVADFLLERLVDLGRPAHLRLSRRRHQRHPRRVQPRRATGSDRSSSRSATRRWRRSWPAPTPSSPARSGVCLATSGPGAIHLLNGLYDAKLDHQPVVAIVGQQARAGLGGNYQQEVDLTTLFKDVAHEYVQMAIDPGADPPPGRPRASGSRSPSAPSPRSSSPTTPGGRGGASSRRTSTAPSTRAPATARRGCCPAEGDLDRAAEVLNAGERVAMLVGAGRPARRRRGAPRSPTCSAPGWPRRCSARRCCPTTCRASPARSACSGPSRAGT